MKKAFVIPIIERVAGKLGIKITVEPEYGYAAQIVTPDGRKRYLLGAHFDLNTLGASAIARDKAYALYFMRHMGYPVPEGEAFFTPRWCEVIGSERNPDAAYRYAKQLGFPVIVKPNGKSQGSGVAKVGNKKELLQAVNALKRNENVFLVQRIVVGNDYRIVVLDGKAISAYRRLPLAVTGDGSSSIRQLLEKKQRELMAAGRETILNTDDIRIKISLKRAKRSMESIVEKGERVELLPNANLSTGGDAVDVTPTLNAAWRKLTAKIAHDMNLRYCGIDVIVRGTLETPPGSYAILEVNASAGLDNFARLGEQQMQTVEGLYEKVLRAMLE